MGTPGYVDACFDTPFSPHHSLLKLSHVQIAARHNHSVNETLLNEKDSPRYPHYDRSDDVW